MNAVVQTMDMQTEPSRSLPANVSTPAELLRIAVTQGADIEKLERLMALQERWEAAEAKRAYVLAMSLFKAEPLTIFKRKQVGYSTKDGDFVGYTHAELSDVTEVVGPAMAKHGLSYRWDVDQSASMVSVTCIVQHAQGHSERVTMSAPPDNSGKKNAIQQIASACTYLQRYTLLASTGMSTQGMDDDGGGADNKDGGSTRKDKWVGLAMDAKNQPALTQVWKDGLAEINAAKDQDAYRAFKSTVVDQKKKLEGESK